MEERNSGEKKKMLKPTLETTISNIIKANQIKPDNPSQIIAKLSEFTTKYMLDILEEAKIMAVISQRTNITSEDVNLILNKNKDKGKYPNSMEELFKAKNRIKLNPFSETTSKLPNLECQFLKSNKHLSVEDNRIFDKIYKLEEKNLNPQKEPPLNPEKEAMEEEEEEEEESLESEETPRKKFKSIS